MNVSISEIKQVKNFSAIVSCYFETLANLLTKMDRNAKWENSVSVQISQSKCTSKTYTDKLMKTQ